MKIQLLFVLALCPSFLICQESSNPAPSSTTNAAMNADAATGNPQPAESKRIFFIIPNYRTSPTLANFEPISPKEKFKIASQDALDRGTFALAGLFAAESQLTKQEPTFGQGAAGFGRYFGTAYGDYFIGDYMTEGVFPTLLHQDPRYFRKGKGSVWARLGYSAGQIFITHGDNAKTEINYSEVVGNSVAVAIGQAYYPSSRDAADAVSKLGTQLGVDMAANILKEFFPDIQRKFSRKHQ